MTSIWVQAVKTPLFASICFIFLAFSCFFLLFLAFSSFFTFFIQKIWKSIFQPRFVVHSTQTLVEINNKCYILLSCRVIFYLFLQHFLSFEKHNNQIMCKGMKQYRNRSCSWSNYNLMKWEEAKSDWTFPNIGFLFISNSLLKWK